VIIVTCRDGWAEPRRERRLRAMRTLLIGGALAVLVITQAACASSNASSSSEKTLQRKADLYAINDIERKFHKATSKHDIDLMMSLWAPNATFTYGPGETATGKKAIRHTWVEESKAFKSNWISETPAYKVRAAVYGDRGALHFECHYVDLKTRKLVVITAADQEVARINGRWLITSMVGGSATLAP
jgi:ketosteroid isomerase-like protein